MHTLELVDTISLLSNLWLFELPGSGRINMCLVVWIVVLKECVLKYVGFFLCQVDTLHRATHLTGGYEELSGSGLYTPHRLDVSTR